MNTLIETQMKPMEMTTKSLFDTKAAAMMVAVATIVFTTLLPRSASGQPTNTNTTAGAAPASNAPPATVDLTASQLNAIKLETVGTNLFSIERTAVGNIDYDEDLSVQVFSPYQGKIITALANLGDDVQKGQPLYTIDSPDLVQAENTLIGAAATFELTSHELSRVTALYGTNGVSEREKEQATSDAQTAEGALKAARDAVRVFGKSQEDIDQIVATRKIDHSLVVSSPVAGRITARNAQAGLLVQPGNAPAPYSVADLSTKWMVANVTETDSPVIHPGQPVTAKVMAFPGRVFNGKVSAVATAIDPNTHRVMLRCDIADPNNELRPGMLATFAIQVQDPVGSAAIPVNGAVRNGDGTFAAWVTTDRKRFSQRFLKLGLQKDGQYQVVEGLQPGELIATDGALYIDNILNAPPSD
jgi:cobalt-zinc-cadmium efflux system membrane fusion protein